jgi:hypothetical protein
MSAQMREILLRRNNNLANSYRVGDELEKIEKEFGLRDANGTARYMGFYEPETRRMFLEIPSIEARKRAISLHNERRKFSNELKELDIELAKIKLTDAKAYGAYSKEIVPILIGLFAVWAGSGIDGVTGAIGGAVAGIFIGFSYLRRKDEERLHAIEIAQDNLAFQLTDKKESYPLPKIFSESDAAL